MEHVGEDETGSRDELEHVGEDESELGFERTEDDDGAYDGAYERHDELEEMEGSFLFDQGLNLEHFNQLDQFHQLEFQRRERLDTVEELTEPARYILIY